MVGKKKQQQSTIIDNGWVILEIYQWKGSAFSLSFNRYPFNKAGLFSIIFSPKVVLIQLKVFSVLQYQCSSKW